MEQNRRGLRSPASVVRLLVLGLLALGTAGIAAAPADAATEVKIGYLPVAGASPLFATIEQGYFKDAGIEPKLVTMATGGAVVPALIAGSLQFGVHGTTAIISAHANGFPVDILSDSSLYGPDTPIAAILVRQDSPLKNAADLEGKVISTAGVGGALDLGLYEWMAARGADGKKVKIVEIPFPQMGGALMSKQVDAIMPIEPFLTILAPKTRVFAYHMREVAPRWHISAYSVMREYAAQNAELMKRVIRAYNRGVDWVNAHPSETRDMLTKFTRLQPALASKIALPEFTKGVSKEVLQNLADMMTKYGVIDKKVEVARFISPFATTSSD
ncbi:MAG: ABC transporter substrate-binding protein [Candidatus Tectomicrobia bacterium]|nr:ABC transporter substrate-binding protein [Candidatus Tectomicrobia bacterium]